MLSAVTNVQLSYELERPITDADETAIANVHSKYGMKRVSITPALDRIDVVYDASRLTEPDVEATLLGCGLPIKRKVNVYL